MSRTHGEGAWKRTTTEYEIWKGMKARCYNANHVGYRYYGARGIKVCERWRESYESFLSDMGRRPSRRHSLDRIDNNGDYAPENCRWATHEEQGRDRNYHELGLKGAAARLASMTPEQREEWCRKATAARLAKQTPEQRRANALKATNARWLKHRATVPAGLF